MSSTRRAPRRRARPPRAPARPRRPGSPSSPAARAAPRRLDRLAERRSPIRSIPAATGSLAGRAPSLGNLVGQRPERCAPPLELRGELGAAGGERLGADAEPLVSGADRGQPAPDLGPLAVALGQALLDLARGARRPRPARPRPRRAPRAPGRGPLGVGELVAWPCSSAASRRAAQLRRLALEPGVDVGGLRLALQRAQRLARLALDVERPVEVVLGALELQLGAATALAVLAEPGRLLDQQAPVARLREDDLLDSALADHRVHLAAEVGVGRGLDHVDEPARARRSADTRPRRPALEPPRDRKSRKSSAASSARSAAGSWRVIVGSTTSTSA